jgi:hypothetical protein
MGRCISAAGKKVLWRRYQDVAVVVEGDVDGFLEVVVADGRDGVAVLTSMFINSLSFSANDEKCLYMATLYSLL